MTLESFEKVKPGDQDKLFQAACPKCDGRIWIFAPIDDGFGAAADPDVRVCKNCSYAHWLRGPNESAVIQLRRLEPVETPRKDRVRALVLSMGKSDNPAATPQMIVDFCARIDDAIEAIK